MKTVTNICLMMLLLLQCACRHQLKPDAYIRYVKDSSNGLVKIATIDGWEYTIQYKPADYIIYLEGKGVYTDSFVTKERDRLKGTVWFDIDIRRTDGSITPLRYGVSSLDEYNSRLDYYLNHAQEDIALAYGTDTLKPMSYLFENNYNLTPQQTMVVGFALPEGQESIKAPMQLSYRDRIFKNGIIKATYRQKDLKNIPHLIFKI